MTKVSIIIPIYNVKRYLSKCLDSVLRQTFKDIEIICVNDCSPDDSLEILNEYAKKDNRIKIINRERNGGLSAARNTGMDVALGEYIYFLDSDDWLDDNYLEKMVGIADKFSADIVLNTNILSEVENEPQKSKLYTNNYGLAPENGELLDSIEAINKTVCMTWAHLYKKSFLNLGKMKFPEGYIHEDISFQFITHAYAKKIVAFNGACYHYLQRNNSIRGTEKDEQIQMFKIYNLIFDYFEKNDLLNKFELKMFETSLHINIDSEDKYTVYKHYFNKIQGHLKIKKYLYSPMDLYFVSNIINTESYSEYVKLYGKNLAISYIRYQKNSKSVGKRNNDTKKNILRMGL